MRARQKKVKSMIRSYEYNKSS